MRYQIKERVFLEWALFYIASELERNDEVDWDAIYSAFEREIWFSLDSRSEGDGVGDLALTMLSDSVPLSAPGDYDPTVEASELIFEGSIATPEGVFFYLETEDDIANGTEAISLKVYRAAPNELTILVEATGESRMSEHILYFRDHPVVSNELISDEQWRILEAHCDALMAINHFSESEAHILFLAISNDLYGGEVVSHVLAHSDHYPQSWIFQDSRDESESRSTADFIRKEKHFAFEEDELKLNALPNRSIRTDPISWMRDALSHSFVFDSVGYHRKMLVYAAWEAFRIPLTGLRRDDRKVARNLREMIEGWHFEHPTIEELRLDTLELIDQTLKAK